MLFSVEFEKAQYELGALEEIVKLIQTKTVNSYHRKALCEAAFGWLWGFLEYGRKLLPCFKHNFWRVLRWDIGSGEWARSGASAYSYELRCAR